jgi:pyroglutamyl-peptidase
MTVLVVGFGPFPGVARNPSADLARALERSRHPLLGDRRIVTAVLPTTYAAVASKLSALLQRDNPDIVLMFGLAAVSRSVRIESRATNAASLLHADAAGAKPDRSVLVEDAPSHLRVRAPMQKLVAAARAAGVPARLSRDAGRYICNASLFACLDRARRTGRPRTVAFVHVPRPSPRAPVGKRRHRRSPSMATLVRAGEAILLALLAHENGR